MEASTRQKLCAKFEEHGAPRDLIQIMEIDQAEATDRLKKGIDLGTMKHAQGQLERIDGYLELLTKAVR